MRYERQKLIRQINEQGQDKLNQARVVVIGCGGLGCPVVTYLVSAGIGQLVLVDDAHVSLSNLNRQFLYTEKDIGQPKSRVARERLEAMNSQVQIWGIEEKLTAANVTRMIQKADVVIDCVDNMETRILLGRECLKQEIPLVEAGVKGFYGWVMSISRETACLECVDYQNPETESPVPIIGTTAGVIGSLQANEAIKILLGIEGVLFGKMLQYDGISGSFDSMDIKKAEDCIGHKV